MSQRLCIWCRGDTAVLGTNKSHVFPAALGNNQGQQVLPPGIVCEGCNSHFSRDVEPEFMADPFVHISAVAQEVTNRTGKERFRDFVFDDQHPAVGNAVAHEYSINIPHLLAHPAQFEIKYTIRGTIEWDYTSRRLAFLSRWAHKMAFESLAWGVVVQQIPVPAGHTSDLLDARYDEVREWARRGQPSNKPRPVFRRPPMGANPTWQPGVWDVAGDLIFQVTVFGDWYAVALTTEHHDAQTLLEKWVTDKWTGHGPIWVVSDTITPWSAPAPAAP